MATGASAMPSSRVGIGVLSAANIANKNIRAIKMTSNAEVVAVGSRDASRAEALLERWGLSSSASAYEGYEAVIADPRVQAVYIALPSALHVPWVKAAATAGKHILLEKPVAVSGTDLEEILRACRDAGVQLMDGTMWSHNPRAQRMAAVLHDSAAVGELTDVTATFFFRASAEFLRSDVRVQPGLDPAGALGDVGWYCVRAMLWAYDWAPPLSVTAHPGAVYNDAGVPMHMAATVLFPGGRRGTLQCGFDSALTQQVLVSGTLGTVQLHDFVVPRHELRCAFTVTGDHRLREHETYDDTRRDEVTVHLDMPQEAHMWETFAGLVQRCQAGGQPDPFWPRATELTQRVLFAVDQSARDGCRTVELSW